MQENESIQKKEENQDVIKVDIWEKKYMNIAKYFREQGDTYKKIRLVLCFPQS